MNILVTGAAGFLGSALSALLKEEGHAVVGYDRRAPQFADERFLSYVQGDLLDLPLLIETIRTYGVERIIHTAAVSHPVEAIGIPYQTVMTNAVGTTNVFEAARLTGVKRIVNLSSEYAYGHNDHLGETNEDAPLRPTGVYGATKVFTEKLAFAYMNHYGMIIPSLRPGWIYGPGQFMQCYMKTLLRNAIDRTATIEPEGRDYGFQYVHVRDVARACLFACTSETLETFVYSITNGEKTTYGELGDIVRALYPDAFIEIGPGSLPELDRYAAIDISRAKRELGYAPSMTLEEGVRSYAAWLEQHPY